MAELAVRVPATSANLGPGFDCVGVALGLYNEIRAEPLDEPRWEVDVRGHGAAALAAGSEPNLTVVAMQLLFARVDRPPAGVRLHLNNQIPFSSGLGSSAAARVGGLFCANELCGRPYSIDELGAMSLELENHPDNITPALRGGLIVALVDDGRIRHVRFDPPPLTAVLAVPDYGIPTPGARKLLPDGYSRADAVYNLAHATLLVAGLVAGDQAAVRAAMDDRLHQPYRLPTIAGAAETIAAAREAGALGAVLSGSGPSLLALVDGDGTAVGQAMRETWARHGANVGIHTVPLESRGAHRIDE